jgi:hypothetical protein
MKGNITLSGKTSKIEALQKQEFKKPPLSIEKQIALLEKRGLKF